MGQTTSLLEKLIKIFRVSDIGIRDIIEIIIISIIIYKIIIWIKDTKAWMLMKGIIILLIFVAIATIFNMQTILFLAESFASVILLGSIVVFQPELRRALEKIGERNFATRIIPFDLSANDNFRFSNSILNAITDAAFEMGSEKTGALIVVEKNTNLTEYERTGIPLDALISKELIINIFEHNTPLHDGAMIIRNDRIVAATCYLPLSDNLKVNKELGTRHRAAIGISEVSDALVVVCSEETGAVSVAYNGEIYRDLGIRELKGYLKQVQKIDKGNVISLGRGKNEKKVVK